MPINFDKLPTENPTQLPPIGIYMAEVIKTEMRQGTDPAKPPYLNLTYALSDGQGKKYGNLFDMMTESAHPVVLYKFGRFNTALKLNLTGNIALENLGKIVMHRKFCVEIEHQLDKKNVMRAQPKVFGSEIFWPIEMYNELVALNGAPEDDGAAPFDTGEFEFNAADGVAKQPAPAPQGADAQAPAGDDDL